MYNLAIRKCISLPILAPRLKIFKWKFTASPGIEPRTRWTRGRHATNSTSAEVCQKSQRYVFIKIEAKSKNFLPVVYRRNTSYYRLGIHASRQLKKRYKFLSSTYKFSMISKLYSAVNMMQTTAGLISVAKVCLKVYNNCKTVRRAAQCAKSTI